MIEKLHHYNCKLIRIVDGDTIMVEVDLGFDISVKIGVRLLGIDTPEINSSYGLEQKAAHKSELYLSQLLQDEELMIRTKKDDMYGRYLCIVYVKSTHEDININNLMLNHGLGKKYDGGRRKPWTDEELNKIINK
jgi:micrococcal nuclease